MIDRICEQLDSRAGTSPPQKRREDGRLEARRRGRHFRDVFPDIKEQRCWWHKIGNVLAALPKSAHPAAKKVLAEIYNAENEAAAVKAAHTFATEYGPKLAQGGGQDRRRPSTC